MSEIFFRINGEEWVEQRMCCLVMITDKEWKWLEYIGLRRGYVAIILIDSQASSLKIFVPS